MKRMLGWWLGAAVIAASGSCKSDAPAPGISAGSALGGTAEPAAKRTGGFAFKINGAPAVTSPMAADEEDEPRGNYMLKDSQLTVSFHGDVAGSPRRGFGTLRVDGWKPEARTYATTVRFVRYLDAQGKKSVVYDSSKETPGTLTITMLTPAEKNRLGETWLAAGTFSSPEQKLAIGFQSTTPTITLTEGAFDGLLIQAIGKR